MFYHIILSLEYEGKFSHRLQGYNSLGGKSDGPETRRPYPSSSPDFSSPIIFYRAKLGHPGTVYINTYIVERYTS